jgi:hypothetical protein
MKKILCLFSIFLVSIVFLSSAKADDAEHYTIKKGDTLWDISGDKFDDQFLWPNLWRVNPQIENPDLIYPGDIIIIPSLEDLLRLPHVPEEKIAVTMPVAPKAEIEKPKKYIIDKIRYLSSGWISPDYPSIGELWSAPDENRSAFGKFDLVYLKLEEDAAVGDKYFAIRNIKKVYHPHTNKFMGYQIRITGILEVIGMDGREKDVPKAEVASSFENLAVGDGLIPYEEIEPPVVPETERSPIIDGYVVESYMNSLMISRGDIIYLDKGNDDGLEVGDTFYALFQRPVERVIGKIQVFALRPTTSSAIILETQREITIGDMWGNR